MAQKVIICGVPHNIVLKEDSYNADGIHLGEIDYLNAEIKINPTLTKTQRTETIWHEIIHGILCHLGYSELNANEQFVTALSNAVANVHFVNETKDKEKAPVTPQVRAPRTRPAARERKSHEL